MHDQIQPDLPSSPGAVRALGFRDRRSGTDRRTDSDGPPDDVSRRRRTDRRESPGGHIRNVLQVLAVADHLRAADDEMIPVDGIRRALWLALMEIERRERRAS